MTSYLSLSMASTMFFADCSDTSCSVDWPPKIIPTFLFFIICLPLVIFFHYQYIHRHYKMYDLYYIFKIACLLRSVIDRKSRRLNSSHVSNSYAVFCLKRKKMIDEVITWLCHSTACIYIHPPFYQSVQDRYFPLKKTLNAALRQWLQ